MDLRQVLYFVTVADELHFARAAERLHISAPSLSQQVKALERHLGVQLLVRDTRHVRLTPAGQRFAESGRGLLSAGHSPMADARAAAGVISGRVRVASLHEAEVAFEPFLTQFHTAYPAIEVSVEMMRHAQLLDALRARTADAALTWSFLLERAAGSEGMQWISVTSTEVLGAVAPNTALADRQRIPRGEALRGTAVVLFERDYSPVTFDYALAELYGDGHDAQNVHEISVTVRAQEAMARAVARSEAIAPLSRPIAAMVRGAWATRPFDPPWLLDGCVVWQRENSSAALVAFMAAAAAAGVQPHTAPLDRG